MWFKDPQPTALTLDERAQPATLHNTHSVSVDFKPDHR